MYQKLFTEKLATLKEQGNYRYFLPVHKSASHFPAFHFERNGVVKKAINFCSNDYLGMSVEEDVIAKMSFALHHTGTGSGGTRNISGTTNYHTALEQTIADWHQKEAALVFGSAYTANFTTLQTLGRQIPDLVFISDEKNHASIIEGMRAVANTRYIYKHNNIAHLQEILESLPKEQPKLIVFEAVYSMNGTIAPIHDIIRLAKMYNALTYIDEVHAAGLYGPTGAGIADQEGVATEIDIINGTLAKSVGVIGGYIAASATLIDFVRSFGSGFIFSSSLPPAICAACEKSIQLIQKHPEFRNTLHAMVQYCRRLLTEAGITYSKNDSHITPIIIGDAKKCKQVADTLLHEYGIYVQPINYPTVPKNESCIRIIVSAKHNREQVQQLIHGLKQVLPSTSLEAI
jgi:5-aminolevulinate synthase